ncbi:hypothetical protein DEO72_LG4g1282 [Vigna unguiculata]|uniref:Uncharacterized protein n=1 Tax=Vigna unguiculata TaxID=3917 RepID=A0A4D6LP58_VIGUN|nr:hypothetical protein DEO72_LG4g1282 [Vigna unguiculata]
MLLASRGFERKAMPLASRGFKRKVTVSLRLPRLKGKDAASHGIGPGVPCAAEGKEVASSAMLLTGHGEEEAAQVSQWEETRRGNNLGGSVLVGDTFGGGWQRQ